MILLVINLFLLIVGMVMDNTPADPDSVPDPAPDRDSDQHGSGPVRCDHGCQSGNRLRNPAIGVNLFVASSLTDVPIMAIAKKAMPMIGLFLVALLLITFIPALSLGLL